MKQRYSSLMLMLDHSVILEFIIFDQQTQQNPALTLDGPSLLWVVNKARGMVIQDLPEFTEYSVKYTS